jgi:hypothetical protein
MNQAMSELQSLCYSGYPLQKEPGWGKVTMMAGEAWQHEYGFTLGVTDSGGFISPTLTRLSLPVKLSNKAALRS